MNEFFSRLLTKPARALGVDDRTIFAGMRIPRWMDLRGFLLCGAQGTGKTQVIHNVLKSARARGDRAVIMDAAGDLMSSHFQPGDVILNPFDERGESWAFFADMQNESEAKEMAASFIPDLNSENKEWSEYARSLVAAVIKKLHRQGLTSNADLYDHIAMLSTEELSELVKGSPVQRLFEEGAERMLSSVLGIVSLNMDSIELLSMTADKSSGFSIREWVKDEQRKGFLWITYMDNTERATKPLRRAWVDIMVRSVLNDLQPNEKRRIWLVIDELYSCGKLDMLPKAINRGRKYGLAVLMGMQALAHLREIYGREGAEGIMACAATLLALRVGDAATADELSKNLGDAQIVRAVESQNSSRQDIVGQKSRGESVNEQWSIEKIVLPSEIQRLKNMEGYLRLPGEYPVAKVQVPLLKLERSTPAEIPHKRSEIRTESRKPKLAFKKASGGGAAD